MQGELSALGVRIADGPESPLAAAVDARERDTLRMVRDALHRRQALLAFQPVVAAGDPGRVAFHEGLIRVLDDAGRVIPARDFIGAVENNEMGRVIDCLSLEMGLAALSSDPGLRLSINMSARSVGYRRWRQTLQRGLARNPTVGERLILEITEHSAMMMPELVISFMADLQKHGIAFALDDFGAGFTAFRHLRDFYFDVIKIDGQFIRRISADTDNQVLTRAMLAVAHELDMFAVAEAVESRPDAEFLAGIGMDCLQGYYFGAPTTTPPSRLPTKERKAG